jgi:hypothetical protein
LPAHDANANLFLGAAPAGSQEAQYRMNAERRGCAFRVTGWLGFCGLRPSAGQPEMPNDTHA